MVDCYKKACLFVAAVAVLAISFPTTSYSGPAGDINCSGLKTAVIGTMNRGQGFLKLKSEHSQVEKAGEYLKFMQLAASYATVYEVFCKD